MPNSEQSKFGNLQADHLPANPQSESVLAQKTHVIQTNAQPNEQFTKRLKEHRRFLRMIVEYDPSPKEIKDLQRTKQFTDMEISLRYMRAEANRKYQFPQRKTSKPFKTMQQVSYSNPNSAEQFGLQRQTQSFNLNYDSQQSNKSIQEDESSDISSVDSAREQLEGKTHYNLRSQNVNNQKINPGKTFNLNQFLIQIYEQEKKEIQSFIKTPSIVSTSCKTLSLQSMNRGKPGEDDRSNTNIKTKVAQSTENKSLEKMRVGRLLEKKRKIKAIKIHHLRNTEKSRNREKSQLQKSLSDEEENLFIGRKFKKQKMKTEPSSNNRYNRNALIKMVTEISELSGTAISKNTQQAQQTKSIQLSKFTDTKILKFPAILGSKRQKKCDQFIKVTKKSPKKVISNGISSFSTKKLKTIQTEKIKMGVQEIIGKKLKTQAHTPQYLSPKRSQMPVHKFIEEQKNLIFKKKNQEPEISNLFTNEKFLNMGESLIATRKKTEKDSPKKQNSCHTFKKFNFGNEMHDSDDNLKRKKAQNMMRQKGLTKNYTIWAKSLGKLKNSKKKTALE